MPGLIQDRYEGVVRQMVAAASVSFKTAILGHEACSRFSLLYVQLATLRARFTHELIFSM